MSRVHLTGAWQHTRGHALLFFRYAFAVCVDLRVLDSVADKRAADYAVDARGVTSSADVEEPGACGRDGASLRATSTPILGPCARGDLALVFP